MLPAVLTAGHTPTAYLPIESKRHKWRKTIFKRNCTCLFDSNNAPGTRHAGGASVIVGGVHPKKQCYSIDIGRRQHRFN
jgi:hypothetical protein